MILFLNEINLEERKEEEGFRLINLMKTSVSMFPRKDRNTQVERSTRLSNITRTKVDYNFTGLRACIKAGPRSNTSRSLDTPFLNESPRALRNETGYL